jgi:PPOX class probable F420-dependent enzyme
VLIDVLAGVSDPPTMNLTESECRARVAAARHAVLATRHPERGVDAVPVVFAIVDSQLVVPLDTVKAKRHRRLGRLANLEGDPRCVLLVEHYDEDWSRLWWVRVHARSSPGLSSPGSGGFDASMAALLDRYPAYRRPGSVDAVLVLAPTAWYGWQA